MKKMRKMFRKNEDSVEAYVDYCVCPIAYCSYTYCGNSSRPVRNNNQGKKSSAIVSQHNYVYGG